MCYIHHRYDHNLFKRKCLCILYTSYCTEHKRNEEAEDMVLTSGSSTELQYLVIGTNSPTCHGTVEERLLLHNECLPRRVEPGYVSTDFWVGKVGGKPGRAGGQYTKP